jgi:ankyrin repeat protein
VVELLLLQDGIIADARDDNGQTPLSLAAAAGHENAVIHLLEAGVDVNSTDSGGDTPLLHSIRNGHEYVSSRLLVEEQIDPNQSNSLGETPLSIAIIKEDVNLALRLLSADDIDPDTTDHNGMSPALLSAQSDNELILGQLVSNHRVNLNARDKTGRSALSWAAVHGNAHSVQLLLADDVDRNPVDIYGDTPLLEAAREGHREAIYYLSRDRGVDVNFKDASGRTALSWASDKGYLSVVNSLLEKDATNPNLTDGRGYSPLHYAVTGGRRDIVQRLLQRDDIDANITADGDTALLHAVKHKRHDLVKLLLEHKSTDPNMKDRDGRTGLSYAIQGGDDSIVQLFLNRNDVGMTDDDDKSALTFALASKDPSIARALLQKHGSQSLHSLIEKGDEVMVELALSAGLDVNGKDYLSRSPLHLAIAFGHSGISSKLITAGAGVDSEDIHGTTPLRVAVSSKDRQLITLLLRKGARTDGIMAEDWFSACGESPSGIIELAENEVGEKTLRFFGPGSLYPKSTEKDLESTQTRRLMCVNLTPFCLCKFPSSFLVLMRILSRFPSFTPFEGSIIPECISRNRLRISQRTICGGRGVSVYLAVWFPAGRSSTASCGLQFPDWGKLAISWTAVPPSPSNYAAGWKSVDHFSMLPYGWIPKDSIECFTMFMDCLEQRWVRVCEIVEEHLSHGVRPTPSPTSLAHTNPPYSAFSVSTNWRNAETTLILSLLLHGTHSILQNSEFTCEIRCRPQGSLPTNIVLGTAAVEDRQKCNRQSTGLRRNKTAKLIYWTRQYEICCSLYVCPWRP